jgi:CHAT domain-containing protein/tetratricopeptide (TPR) repeat protein
MKIYIPAILLLIIIIIPLNTSYPTKKVDLGKTTPRDYNIDINTLRLNIQRSGWDNNSLLDYQRYLVNSSIDQKKETELLDGLPGKFEKTFLYAVILKRGQEFKKMFASLLACLDYKPSYYPFYDELIFSSNATNQDNNLESKLTSIHNYPEPQLKYLQGLIELSRNNFNNAKYCLEEALKSDSTNSNILYQLSYAYRNSGNYEAASMALQKAMKFNRSDKWFTAAATIAMGSLFYLSQKYDAAEKLYRKGNKDAILIHDKYDQAVSLIDIGIMLDEKGDIKNSRQSYEWAINISDEINNIEVKALALSELGVSFSYTNNLVEAKNNYSVSYKLFQRAGNTGRLSLLAYNLGNIYISLFNFEAALHYFNEGLHNAGDNKRSRALNLLGLADVYANISDYAKALNYYRQVQDISSQIKDIEISADAFTGLGALNFNIDNFNNAIRYYFQAAKIISSSTNPFLKSKIYDNLGLTFLQLDSLEEAKDYFQQSYILSEKNKDYHTESLSACDLTEFYIKNNNLNEAEKYLIAAKQAAFLDGSKYLTATADLAAGTINLKKNINEKSIEDYKDAITTAKEINDNNIQIEANYLLAKLYEGMNKGTQADNYYKSAIEIIEDVSYNLFPKEDIQISYFTSKDKVYDSYINFLLNQKKFSEAFEVIDRSKSRNTMQNLTNLKLEELINDKHTLEQVYDYNQAINSGIYNGAQTDSMNLKYNILKQNLLQRQPELKQYFESQSTISLKTIQRKLNNNEYIISIYPARDKVYTFLISKNIFIPFSANVPLKDLLDKIRSISPYYRSGSSGQDYYNKDLFSFNTLSAYGLYASILKPVFESIPENCNVIISSSPELISVPFEFLVKSFKIKDSPYDYNNKDYLIYHYNISYTPSAALYIKQKENNLINNGKVLLVGNPTMNNLLTGYADRRGLLEGIEGLNRNMPLLPLKYSGEEVSRISDIITADKVLTGNNATETNFKEYAPLSKIIHLSTHSFIFNKQPVIFFSNSYDPDNDGYLETGEIVKMKLNSDLVVLSSCNSGNGVVDRSEGVLGMTKAFFEAGAKSVVVSLWEVDDKYTSELMSLFYKRLSEGYDKSQALRYAKMDFIKEYSPNPYYWSAFVLSGNISQLQLRAKTNISPYIIGILIIIGIALLLTSIRSKYKLI